MSRPEAAGTFDTSAVGLVTVAANGPGQWRRHQARVDLEIGSLEGDPNLTFGRLEEMAVQMVAGLRATPRWLEPLRLDVFAPDGSYLGSVEGPPGIGVRAVSGNAIWGYRNGNYGEQYLVRLRIVE